MRCEAGRGQAGRAGKKGGLGSAIAVAGLGTGQVAVVYVFEGVAPPETLIALSLVIAAGMIALRASMGLIFAREFTREALEEARAEAA